MRLWYIHTCAGVVKLADALDSKSCGLIIRVGSSPTAGTNEKTTLQTTVRLFFHISAQAECLHSRLCGYMKKISVYADARLLLSAVGGIIYRRSLFIFADGGLKGAGHLAHRCAPTPCR